MNYKRYRIHTATKKENRKWPDRLIEKAPIWCSVDLRDGNQALVNPMNLEQKLAFFHFLTDMGFKEIEVGFPAASDTEFLFTRKLIETEAIPKDVTIQVLTQARDHIIEKTFKSIQGVKKAIVHLYNSTSILQRDVVFGKSKDEIMSIAVTGAKLVKKLAKEMPESDIRFEYSPESFTGTELDYAIEVCNAVLDVWQPTSERKVIINLPSTVEMDRPNVYADQIEYMCENIAYKDSVIISVHTHNDRGCAVAASELALLAGADRVEGTLFGNGERTGNADIMNIAMNLFSEGIDPKLDFSKMGKVVDIYEESTKMMVSKRHPYAGELVYTAFSGSHQDAIRKGMLKMKEHPDVWEVPYLPIDPLDVGKSYEPIIRINSQSGKGGVAFVLENNYGLYLPKEFQQEFSLCVTKYTDATSGEIKPSDVFDLFNKTYINIESPIKYVGYSEKAEDELVTASLEMEYKGENKVISGCGSGVLDALCKSFEDFLDLKIEISDYSEHAMEYGSRSRAISYVHINLNGKNYYGAGISKNIVKSSIKALISALNIALITCYTASASN